MIGHNYSVLISSALSEDDIKAKILSYFLSSVPADIECIDNENLIFQTTKLGFPAHHNFPVQYQLSIDNCGTVSNILVEISLKKPTAILMALFSLLCIIFQVALLAAAQVFSIALLIPLLIVLFLHLMVFVCLRIFSRNFINILHVALSK